MQVEIGAVDVVIKVDVGGDVNGVFDREDDVHTLGEGDDEVEVELDLIQRNVVLELRHHLGAVLHRLFKAAAQKVKGFLRRFVHRGGKVALIQGLLQHFFVDGEIVFVNGQSLVDINLIKHLVDLRKTAVNFLTTVHHFGSTENVVSRHAVVFIARDVTGIKGSKFLRENAFRRFFGKDHVARLVTIFRRLGKRDSVTVRIFDTRLFLKFDRRSGKSGLLDGRFDGNLFLLFAGGHKDKGVEVFVLLRHKGRPRRPDLVRSARFEAVAGGDAINVALLTSAL